MAVSMAVLMSEYKAHDVKACSRVAADGIWSTRMNELFDWQVMQIFYPYSLQQFPYEFPGEDPRDCPRNVNKEQLVVISFFCLSHEQNLCIMCSTIAPVVTTCICFPLIADVAVQYVADTSCQFSAAVTRSSWWR